jgi:hypothetical protein
MPVAFAVSLLDDIKKKNVHEIFLLSAHVDPQKSKFLPGQVRITYGPI